MAKKARKRAPKKPVRRRHSRVERERRMRQLIIWITVAVGILVVGLVAYGLLSQQIKMVIKMRQPVAIVNDAAIKMSDLRDRARFLEGLGWSLSSPTQVDYILDQLIREELVRQEAARRGIAVTPDQVQERIEREFGYHRTPPTPEPTPTGTPTLTATEMLMPTSALTATEVLTPTPTTTPSPTATPMTEEDFRQKYDEYLESVGVSDAYFRSVIEAEMLQDALVDDFGREVPTTADQVQLRYLQVYSETQASALLVRLDGGEVDFDTLGAEVKADEANPGSVGELEWYPEDVLVGDYSKEFADQAFGLQTGVFSQTVESEYGSTSYFIVEVLDHEERKVDEGMRERLAQRALTEWIEAQMALVERLEYDPTLLMPES